MKNLLLIAAIIVGLNIGNSGYAQDDTAPAPEEQTQSKNDGLGFDKDDPAPDRKADHQDKSKVGNALHETGSAVGRGAKWTGGKVKDGASWTWDKAKHNKVTKNTFNQPGDE